MSGFGQKNVTRQNQQGADSKLARRNRTGNVVLPGSDVRKLRGCGPLGAK